MIRNLVHEVSLLHLLQTKPHSILLMVNSLNSISSQSSKLIEHSKLSFKCCRNLGNDFWIIRMYYLNTHFKLFRTFPIFGCNFIATQKCAVVFKCIGQTWIYNPSRFSGQDFLLPTHSLICSFMNSLWAT